MPKPGHWIPSHVSQWFPWNGARPLIGHMPRHSTLMNAFVSSLRSMADLSSFPAFWALIPKRSSGESSFTARPFSFSRPLLMTRAPIPISDILIACTWWKLTMPRACWVLTGNPAKNLHPQMRCAQYWKNIGARSLSFKKMRNGTTHTDSGEGKIGSGMGLTWLGSMPFISIVQHNTIFWNKMKSWYQKSGPSGFYTTMALISFSMKSIPDSFQV